MTRGASLLVVGAVAACATPAATQAGASGRASPSAGVASAATAAQGSDAVPLLQERVARLERRLADMDARLGLLLAQRSSRAAPPVAGVVARGVAMGRSSEEASIGGRVGLDATSVLAGTASIDLGGRSGFEGDDEPRAGPDGDDVVHEPGLEPGADGVTVGEAPDGLGDEVADDGPPILIKLRGQPEERSRLEPGVRADRAVEAGRSIDDVYELAHARLKIGQAADAAAMFDEILARGGAHALMDNAMYWAGFARAQQADHRRAIAVWQRLPLRFPRSAKIPDALYGMAVAHEALGEPAVAETLYAQLLAQFPRAEKANESRKALARLRPR